MGLDMMLMKAKRYNDTTANEISAIDDYFGKLQAGRRQGEQRILICERQKGIWLCGWTSG